MKRKWNENDIFKKETIEFLNYLIIFKHGNLYAYLAKHLLGNFFSEID